MVRRCTITIWENEIVQPMKVNNNCFLHLNFPNALLKRFNLVIVQHEKQERHADERSQSKYPQGLIILSPDRGTSVTDQVSKAGSLRTKVIKLRFKFTWMRLTKATKIQAGKIIRTFLWLPVLSSMLEVIM